MAAPVPGGAGSPAGPLLGRCPSAHTQQKEPEGPVSCLLTLPAGTISSLGVPAAYPHGMNASF